MKKSKTRIFINKPISANLMIYIKAKQHHFLKNVLRVQINDFVNVFDGISGEWESRVSSINRDNIVLQVLKKNRDILKSQDIWLVFAPIKSHRMILAVQKATELGVSKIFPCITEYTNNRNIKIKSLQDNIIEAAEQSDRMDIPTIAKEQDLQSFLSKWPEDRKLLYCDEKVRDGKNIIETLLKLKEKKFKWGILIGPEGGFSEKENKFINNNKNAINVSLGETLLRSDTAITVSLFCIHQVFSG
tara:strand:- start:303 stop:1037 length:735 start_codon:yes stop_codon:yes gene_type:complete